MFELNQAVEVDGKQYTVCDIVEYPVGYKSLKGVFQKVVGETHDGEFEFHQLLFNDGVTSKPFVCKRKKMLTNKG